MTNRITGTEPPSHPRALRVEDEAHPDAEAAPAFLYWILWDGVRILVLDLSLATKDEADRRNLVAADLLERHPEWRAPFLVWTEGTPPPDARSEPVIRRLSAACESLGARQAVAGLSPLVYLAVRLINRLRRNKLFPFTTLGPALAYLTNR